MGALRENLGTFHIVNIPICMSTIQRERFPWQQWLCERATGLYNAYIACLVYFKILGVSGRIQVKLL